jgi:hypothetical protein
MKIITCAAGVIFYFKNRVLKLEIIAFRKEVLMGSLNLHPHLNPKAEAYQYPRSQVYTLSKQYKPLTQDSLSSISPTLMVLINSVYYFLEYVYILEKQEHYQLVVIHNSRVLTYRDYKTRKGAKIAFQKLYRDKAWKKGVKAEWTHPYKVDHQWFKEKDDLLSRHIKPLKAYSI